MVHSFLEIITNPGPNVHVLGLHQKMRKTDGWERFLSDGDNKNNIIALFLKFVKSSESEDYRKYIVWYFIVYICHYLRPFARNSNFHKKIIWFIKRCVSWFGTIRHFKNWKHLRNSLKF